MGENDSAEKVKLNLMSLDGKRVKVLGMLFGGQGDEQCAIVVAG